MRERDGFELEMSPGMQPPSGLGDRILVGLALVVLVAGAFIAVGNMLPDSDGVAQASPDASARPSRTLRPSPMPDQPRVATIQDPDVEVSPQQQVDTFSGLIRALRDIPVMTSTDSHGAEIATLKKDDIAYANEEGPADAQGWLYLQDPTGYIASVVDGVEQVRRYQYPRFRYSGGLSNLVAGPDGFTALLNPPGGPMNYEPARTAISSDGSTWTSLGDSLVDTWNGGSVAWGPAGWLAATYVSDGSAGRLWIWSSADGLSWIRLGMLGGIEGEFVARFVGSERGYLLETAPEQGGYSRYGNTIWSSTDGQTWVESRHPAMNHAINGERRLVALESGFYLWDSSVDRVQPTQFAAFSADGQAWSVIENGPDGIGLQLASLAGGIVAIDLNRTTLAPRVWSAVVDAGQVSWIRESSSDQTFGGAFVRQLVSDGTRVYAFGWDASTQAPLVWSGNGTQWVRSALPESFGGIPSVAAAGPAGVVVVGSRHTLRGDNPVFWHRTPTGRWLPEPDPILEYVPEPTADCPAQPGDVPEFVTVDAAAQVACHGAQPFTFRAYSVACSDCSGETGGNPEPAWLLNPRKNQLYLGPSESAQWFATAVLGPSLELDPAWTGAWIEITGHYDDPAAQTCRQDVDADSIEWWSGLAWLIDQCRETFVVTAVKVVGEPP